MIKIHPLFAVLSIIVLLNGEFALFSIYFVALVLHELGHLAMAKVCRIKVERCTIYPYGGELIIENEWTIPYEKRILLALGGPMASACCLVFAELLTEPFATPFYKMNFFLLCINLLPIWPLDGGRVLLYFSLAIYDEAKVYHLFITTSMLLGSCFVLYAGMHLPAALPLFILSLFLLIKVFNEWKVRKYRTAFEKNINRRLT